MNETLYDPSGEFEPPKRLPRAKPASLAGLTIGLLDISKSRGDVFLDELDHLLSGEGLTVKRYKKPTFTRPAPLELLQQIAGDCDVVVEGLAD